MQKGFLSIVLHAHLPFVRHPEYDNFFEEIWLFEAITECYIPLIRSLEKLHRT
jgi:1,4-alpha-glucan branching enzyme